MTATRSILITGCSSGIGYAAAHGMRACGWRVFAACRQQADCDRLSAEGFDAPRLDYTDEASIQSALAQVLEQTGGTLDAVFNNGAHATPGLVEDLPTDALREIFEANFFGWHSLTRAVIPVMRKQGHGRIVQCSSVLGMVAVVLLPDAGEAGGFLTGLGFRGWHWVVPLMVPILVGAVAFAATGAAARRTLRELT
jgi:NAD(P)-dependent dehydrogenase (short-subunit alcohol dehydrogenase family)